MSPGFIKGTADSLPKAAVTLRLPLGAIVSAGDHQRSQLSVVAGPDL